MNTENTQEAKGILALTLVDGRVLILKGTFDKVLHEDIPNPGFLASVLYHESRHFTRISQESVDDSGRAVENVGWASPEEEELFAYSEELKTAHIFGLTKDEVKEVKRLWKENDEAVRANELTSRKIDPRVETLWEDYYKHRQINLEDEYKNLMARVEEARKQQDQTAAEDARHRQAQADREAAQKAAQDQFDQQADIELRRCNFVPRISNSRFQGYDRPSDMDSVGPYEFPGQTMDQLKVSLMLTLTCNKVYVHSAESVDLPCNEGLDILNQHEGDAAFMNGVGALKHGKPDECVSWLLRAIPPHVDFQKYQHLLDRTLQMNKRINENTREYNKNHTKHIGPGNSDDDDPPPVHGGRNPPPRPGPPADPCTYYGGIRMCPQ